MKAAEASIKVLLDDPLKKTAELIKEAQAEYEGRCSCSVLEYRLIIFYSQLLLEFTFKPDFSLSALPPDSKLHNLLLLAAKDLEIAPAPETVGSNLLVQHQKLIMEHFRHKNTVVLPEDVIQKLLLGVSNFGILHFCSTFPSAFWSLIIPMISFHFLNDYVLYFQSTRTLELALHLKSKVIRLKQDALRLMNIALLGTACSQLLTLFEFTFGYPESRVKKWG